MGRTTEMSAEIVKQTGIIIILCHLLFGPETLQPSQLKCLAVTSLRDFCPPPQ